MHLRRLKTGYNATNSVTPNRVRMSPESSSPSTSPASKRENVWLNLGLNVVIPSLLMSKGEGWYRRLQARDGETINVPSEIAGQSTDLQLLQWIPKPDELVEAGDTLCKIGNASTSFVVEAPAQGSLVPLTTIGDGVELGSSLGAVVDGGLPAFSPAVLLVVALAFPLGYGIYDFITRNKYNFFSMLGFVSILISGSVGLLQLDKDLIAIKEAAIPALFAIAVLVSLRTRFPLIRTLLYSPELFDVPKVEAALRERSNEKPFEQLMTRCTLYLAGSFILSAVLNYVLARYFIRSETGTAEFVKEMGNMTFWSWPIIMVPSMAIMMFALMQLVAGIEKYTGYEMEDVILVGNANNKNTAKKAETKTTDASDSEAVADKAPDNKTPDSKAPDSQPPDDKSSADEDKPASPES